VTQALDSNWTITVNVVCEKWQECAGMAKIPSVKWLSWSQESFACFKTCFQLQLIEKNGEAAVQANKQVLLKMRGGKRLAEGVKEDSRKDIWDMGLTYL
jgi:hypothetical protein